jgi:hypothetical protein
MSNPPNPLKPTVNYDVAFSAIRIKTRASTLGRDTVYIKISVSVDGHDKGRPIGTERLAGRKNVVFSTAAILQRDTTTQSETLATVW